MVFIQNELYCPIVSLIDIYETDKSYHTQHLQSFSFVKSYHPMSWKILLASLRQFLSARKIVTWFALELVLKRNLILAAHKLSMHFIAAQKCSFQQCKNDMLYFLNKMMESTSGVSLIYLDTVFTMGIKTFIASRFRIMRTVLTNEKNLLQFYWAI